MRSLILNLYRHPSESWGLGPSRTNARDASFRWHDGIVLLLCILTFCGTSPVFAQGSGPIPALANQQLENPAQEVEATRVMHGLRCIQCQGQSIADSDAPMAATMRAEVRQQIASGKQPDDIREWMIQRYGEWVSFEPEMRGAGLLLWATPIVILLLGAWLARGLFRRRV